jgi:hypothetical protein
MRLLLQKSCTGGRGLEGAGEAGSPGEDDHRGRAIQRSQGLYCWPFHTPGCDEYSCYLSYHCYAVNMNCWYFDKFGARTTIAQATVLEDCPVLPTLVFLSSYWVHPSLTSSCIHRLHIHDTEKEERLRRVRKCCDSLRGGGRWI